MRRALLAWESGSGRGHIVALKKVAEAISDRFECDAALCRMKHADELAQTCISVFQSRYLSFDTNSPRTGSGVQTATWGEFLGDIGFRKPEFLAAQIAWWKSEIQKRRITLVVADFAPCAMLAARSLGIPCVAISPGYGLPPGHLVEFPVLIPEFATRLYDEADIVAAINEAGVSVDLPPLEHLPQIYDCEAHIVRTLPMLDPHHDARAFPVLSPIDAPMAEIEGAGDEVFVYFSTNEASEPEVIRAIGNLGLPTRAFAPALDEAGLAALAAQGVIVQNTPYPLDLIRRRARILVNAGQHGTLCFGMMAGLPQVALPQHLEHSYYARRAAHHGMAQVIERKNRTFDSVRDTIRATYSDSNVQAHCSNLGRELRDMPHRPVREQINEMLYDL